MIVEVLVPVDPPVSLTPYQFDLRDSTNPDTGVLYIAANDQLLLLNVRTTTPPSSTFTSSAKKTAWSTWWWTPTVASFTSCWAMGPSERSPLTDSAFQTPGRTQTLTGSS